MKTVGYSGQKRETKYRVSIKSLPDYKLLLQENYVEYKNIFLNVNYIKF
jgi:hypothetical protein